MNHSRALLTLGAHRQGRLVCAGALRAVSALPGPTREDTASAEACGMLHLTTAFIAAGEGRTADAATHLEEARSLAAHTGERNHMHYHFGPTNVAAWELTIAVEAGTGPGMAERFLAAPIDLSVFDSKERVAYVYLDLAEAWAQAQGLRDDQALRALDTADRLNPVRMRHSLYARNVLLTLDQRLRRRSWELDSLRHRFGLGGPS